MSLKGSRARSQARKERLARESQTEHTLDQLHFPKTQATNRVLDVLHVPHASHAKAVKSPATKGPYSRLWAKHKSKVSVGVLVVASFAALTLGVLAHG
jgi:hypothetical protein